MTPCEHLELKKCLVGELVGETEFYKCRECGDNFTVRPLKIEVTYTSPAPSGVREGN